jgi:pectinesterase
MKTTIQKAFLLISFLLATIGVHAEVHYDMIVAADGSGTHTTVQAAINAVPDYRKTVPTRILIRRGKYHEKVIVPESKDNLWLIGEEGAVITYDDYASKPNAFGENMGTSGSATIYIFGKNFRAENITFENAAGPVGQAVACFVCGDRAVFRHCRFIGSQDTLYTYGEHSRQYYEDCYIEGTVDYIFGKSTAFFLRCQLHSKRDGYITAPATPQGHSYGYVFKDCRLTAGEGVGKVHLSRPWRPFARCVFLHCEMGSHITPKGWHNWGKPSNEQTVLYAEYDNYGPGADTSQRVPYARQLAGDTEYELSKVLAGNDGWNPTENK